MTNTTFVLGIVLAAIISIGSLVTIGPMAQRAENDIMAQEVITVVSAVSSMGRQEGYDDLGSFADLAVWGYLDSQYYTDGSGENYLKRNITAIGSGDEATVTYDAGTTNSCKYILSQEENFTSVTAGAGTCDTAGVLTLTVR